MNNNLQHHGIKGQKWGVRRFQNKDGSLTLAGRKRQKQNNDGPTHEDHSRQDWEHCQHQKLQRLHTPREGHHHIYLMNPLAYLYNYIRDVIHVIL